MLALSLIVIMARYELASQSSLCSEAPFSCEASDRQGTGQG
jgi:hypothetical protein